MEEGDKRPARTRKQQARITSNVKDKIEEEDDAKGNGAAKPSRRSYPYRKGSARRCRNPSLLPASEAKAERVTRRRPRITVRCQVRS